MEATAVKNIAMKEPVSLALFSLCWTAFVEKKRLRYLVANRGYAKISAIRYSAAENTCVKEAVTREIVGSANSVLNLLYIVHVGKTVWI